MRSVASQGSAVRDMKNIVIAVVDWARSFGRTSIVREASVSLIIQFAVGRPIFGSQS